MDKAPTIRRWYACIVLLATLALTPQGALATDLTVGEISLPRDTVMLGDSTGIYFEIRNINRLPAADYYTDVTIRRVSGGSVVFTEDVEPLLIPAYNFQYFATRGGWRPTVAGTYELRITITFSEDIDVSNNSKVKVIHVVEPPCDETRPTASPSGTLLKAGPSGATLRYTTTEPCCWTLRASPAAEPSSEVSVSPSSWVTLRESSPVAFTFTTTHTDRPYMLKVEWRRCGDDATRVDYYVLYHGPDSLATITGGSAPSSGSALDPVNTFTGELYLPSSPDIVLNGPMPLAFTRYYASSLSRAGVTGGLGPNWSHAYQWRLFLSSDTALVLGDRGRSVVFARSAGAWRPLRRSDSRFALSTTGPGAHALFDPESRLVRSFDDSGRLRSVSDARGNAHTLAYDAEGRLSRIADATGGSLAIVHDTAGRIASVSDGARTVRYAYDGGVLTSVVDLRGNTHRYAYASGSIAGLLAAHTQPEGNVGFVQEYDAAGRVVRQRNAAGGSWSFLYTDTTTVVTDPAGASRTHVHSRDGRLLEHRDESGRAIRFGYDEHGRRTLVVDRDGDTTRLSYDAASGLVGSVRDPDGAITRYEYTTVSIAGVPVHVVSRVVHPDGLAERHEYDGAGRLTALVDRSGARWGFGYGARGELLFETTPAGDTTAYSYAPSGMLASVRDAAGNVTRYTHDALRRVTELTHPDGARLRYTYDEAGNILSVRDERGGVWLHDYDRNGRLVSSTSPLGAVVRLGYDAMDRVTRHEAADGGVWMTEYDSLGRTRALVDAAGNRVEYSHDERGRVVAVIDGEERRWEHDYSDEGLSMATTRPDGSGMRVERDRMGRVTEISYGGESRVSTEYDVLGRPRRIVDAEGGETEVTLGPRGEALSVRIAPSIAASYDYDGRGAVTGITDPNGSEWMRRYDGAGRLASTTDPLGNRFTYGYDERNRIDTIDLPDGAALAIAYDATGNVVRRSFSDGLSLEYDHDADGRLTGATGIDLTLDRDGRIIGSNGIAAERDGLGRITAITLAPGRGVTYAYDRRNLVTEVRDWRGRVTKLDYDDAGRLAVMTRPNGTVARHRYDSLGRLAAIVDAHSEISLRRDRAGRVVSATRTLPLRPTAPPADRTMSYDAASQLATAVHDERGRVVRDGSRVLRWDAATRLREYEDGGATVRMTYDALGHRLSRTEGSTTQGMVWNYALDLPSVSILTVDSANSWYFVHTPDGRLLYAVSADDASERQYHFDENGSTLYLTDATGAITDRYAYSPYGMIVRRDGTTPNPFTFVGRDGVIQEGESGLYLMRARYYDATTGRFLSRDPLGAIGPRSINPYQYAFGNPVRFVDVTGRAPNEPDLPPGFPFGNPFGHFEELDKDPRELEREQESARRMREPADPELSDAEWREKVRREMEEWQRDLDRFAQRDRDRAEDQRRFEKAMRWFSTLADEMEPKDPPLTSTPRPPAPPEPPSNATPHSPPPAPPAAQPATPPGGTPKPAGTSPAPAPRPAPRGVPGGPGTRGMRDRLPREVIDILEYFIIVD